jgi:hypothetical protein
MSIAVVCSNCSAKLNAPDGAAGKKVKCPKCQSPIVVPDAVQFEVVEDEPAPAKRPGGKPARVKAAIEDEDDDDRPRKKRRTLEDDDEEDDDRPRKKKRKKGGDEEGGVSMTRNIVMGVVLIILVAVAAYIFYDRSQKQKEADQQKSSSNAGGNTTPRNDPGRNVPLPKRDPAPIGGASGNSDVATAWKPNPSLLKDLTQQGKVAGYVILLPERFATVPNPVNLPPNLQQGAWASHSTGGELTALVSVAAFFDAEAIESASKNMRQLLVNYSAGFTDVAGFKIATRGPTEIGTVNALEFSRFTFTATAPNQAAVNGVVYGAIDGERVVTVIGMGLGSAAAEEFTLIETIIATFKKS